MTDLDVQASPLGAVYLVITAFTLLLLAAALALSAAAVYLRVRNHRKARRWAALELRWEPLVLDVLAGAAPAALNRAVSPKDRFFFVGFLLRYARRVRGEELAVVRGLAVPFLPELIEESAREDAERRARTVHTVATLGLSHHVRFVVEALRDPSPLVAMIAASALLREGRHDQIDAVLETLPRFSLWSRIFVARTLSEAGSGAAHHLRLVLADRSKDPMARAVAAEALRELADLGSADVAASVADQEDDRELRATSLRLLGDLGRPEHRGVILRLADSPDSVVRGAAIGAIATVGGPGEVPLLERALQDESPWVALKAARGLVAMGATGALSTLAAAPAHPRSSLASEVLAEP
ncbi:MAG: HEAT repeat domain-containing protein [Longimicrobiales bacterium]|nr:HEAT repeat domain-containing protein [Longimicrobiales bacterium]